MREVSHRGNTFRIEELRDRLKLVSRQAPGVWSQRQWCRALLLLVCCTVIACEARKVADSGPAARTRSFLSAVQREDCEEAWSYFSAETQRAIEKQSARYVSQSPWYAESFSPTRLYCVSTIVNPYGSYVPESVELIRLNGHTAVVRVQDKIADSYAIPGFFPTSYRLEPREIDLVFEDGEWKISKAIPDGG